MPVHGLLPALVTLAQQTTAMDRAAIERTIEILHLKQPTQDSVIWYLTRAGGGTVRTVDIVNALLAQHLSRQKRAHLFAHVHHRLVDLEYERVAPGTFRRAARAG